ncbi:MAG: DUF2480 family protein [Nitritalea sp.]
MSEIVNRVAQSPLYTLDLETFYQRGERVGFDLAPFLWQGLALKEADFREALKGQDWSSYAGKFVYIHCSADAIIPHWAYMLVGTYLQDEGVFFVVGDANTLEQALFDAAFAKFPVEEVEDRPLVVKGCSSVTLPLYVYGKVLSRLQGHVKSIMWGEPCSTVPLYKRKRK